MEENVKVILEEFAIECLSFDASPPYVPNYDEKDMENVMHIFMHVFCPLLFKKAQADKLDLGGACDVSESAGNELRQLLIKYTGIDMHKVR